MVLLAALLVQSRSRLLRQPPVEKRLSKRLVDLRLVSAVGVSEGWDWFDLVVWLVLVVVVRLAGRQLVPIFAVSASCPSRRCAEV